MYKRQQYIWSDYFVKIHTKDDADIEGDKTVNVRLVPHNTSVVYQYTDFLHLQDFTLIDNDDSDAPIEPTPPVETPENTPPIAGLDRFTVSKNASLLISSSELLSNDLDADGDTLSITSVSDAQQGSVELQTSGSILFTPFTNATGLGSFSYTVSDGNGGTTTGQVKIKIDPQASKPNPNPDRYEGVTKSTLTIGTHELLSNDTGTDELSIVAVSNPSSGKVSLKGDLVYFTPDSQKAGLITFDYTAEDKWGIQTSATVTVEVSVAAGSIEPVEVVGDGENNSLSGGDGDDTLYGYDGDDRFDGGSGDNQYFGGNGTDTVIYADFNRNDLTGEQQADGSYKIWRPASSSLSSLITELTSTSSTQDEDRVYSVEYFQTQDGTFSMSEFDPTSSPTPTPSPTPDPAPVNDDSSGGDSAGAILGLMALVGLGAWIF